MPKLPSWLRPRALRALGAWAIAICPAVSLAAHPFPVTLKDASGNSIDPATSTVPYSPERTCGACHDTHLIAQGYHFQQGRTNGAGYLNVSDTFAGAMMTPDASGNSTLGAGAWWKLSDGMYGKW